MHGYAGKNILPIVYECIGLYLVLAFFTCLLPGCVKNTEDQTVLPHSTSAGSMTISYPDGFPNVRETSATSLYLPEGVSCDGAVLIANDDYSTVIELTSISDPNDLGIAAVEDYWQKLITDFPKDENDDEFEQQFPGLRTMAEEAVVEEPQYIVINGNRALTVSQTVKAEVRQVFYYIESGNRIVGLARGTFPNSKYLQEPSYFDSIFSSIKIS